MGLVVCKVWWMGLGNGGAYLQGTLLLADYKSQGNWVKGLGVLSHCGCSREWGVLPRGSSLTSYVRSVLEQAVFQSSTKVAGG